MIVFRILFFWQKMICLEIVLGETGYGIGRAPGSTHSAPRKKMERHKFLGRELLRQK